ncbi:hypothetical protein [Shimia sediminis]|nr:hypothetical protein [Shimia sediminis]
MAAFEPVAPLLDEMGDTDKMRIIAPIDTTDSTEAQDQKGV